MAWAGSASAASRSVLQSATLWARATAARRSASRPVSSKRGTNRSWPSASPPSAMIGIKAFARCWVEPMRPVAPLTMMPIVWLAIVQFRCVAEGEGRSPLEHIPVALMQNSGPACVPRGLDPRVHHSSQELFAKRMGCRVNPGNDEIHRARLCYAACMRVHVPGEQGAAPHRLPELRLRHAIGFHRPRHDEPDGDLARGVRLYRRAANPWFAQVSWHPRDLVRAGIYHRESSTRVRGAAARRA